MAIRTQGSSDALRRPLVGMPISGNVTVCGWARRIVETFQWSIICALENLASGATRWYYIGYGGSNAFQVFIGDGSSGGFGREVQFPTTYPLNTDFFWAMTSAGAGIGDFQAYAALPTDTSFQNISETGTNFDVNSLSLGVNSYSEFHNGRIGPFFMWHAVLTEQELLAQRYTHIPQRWDDLAEWIPCIDRNIADIGRDYGPGENNYTVSGTPVVEDSPPIIWAPQPTYFYRPVTPSGGISINPSPVVMALSLPTPTVDVGALNLAPTPVPMALQVPTPTLSLGALPITPTPTIITLALPTPMVSLGALALLPTPVGMSINLPTPIVDAGAINLTPTPVVMPLAVPTPAVDAGVINLTPSPVTMPLAVPTPTVGLGPLSLMPTPVVTAIAVPTPSVVIGGVPINPSPVTMPLTVPTPTVERGVLDITPTPVGMGITLPMPMVDFGQIAIRPTPVVMPLQIPTPQLGFGTLNLQPSPVIMGLQVPTSTVGAVLAVSPSPIVMSLVMPTPAVSVGPLNISASPVTLQILLPTPTITGFEMAEIVPTRGTVQAPGGVGFVIAPTSTGTVQGG